jgi:hypothetical protein
MPSLQCSLRKASSIIKTTTKPPAAAAATVAAQETVAVTLHHQSDGTLRVALALVGPCNTVNKAERSKARVDIVKAKVKAAMAFVMPPGGKKSATAVAEVLLCDAAVKAAVDAAPPPTSEKAVLETATTNSDSKVPHQVPQQAAVGTGHLHAVHVLVSLSERMLRHVSLPTLT